MVGEPLAQISLVLDMMLTCPGDIQHIISRYYSSRTHRDCCWCNSRCWWPPMMTPNKTATGITAADIGSFRSRSIGLKNGLFQSSTTGGIRNNQGPLTLIAWDWGYLRARSPWWFECEDALLHLAGKNKRKYKKEKKIVQIVQIKQSR